MRVLASYIMRGRYQAILVIAISAALSILLPPFSYLSGAGVGLVTLRHGPQEGMFVSLGAALGLGIFAHLLLGNPFPGLAFALLVGLPMWGLAWTLRSTASLALTVTAAALLGVLLIISLHLLVPSPAAQWRAILDTLKPALTQSGMFSDAQLTKAGLDQLAQGMTLLLASATVLSLTISLFIARWWQAILYNPGGFRAEFHELRLMRSWAAPTLAVLAVAVLANGAAKQIALELLVVMLIPYMIQGVALVHRVMAKLGAHVAWLVAMYGLLLVALPQMAMVLMTVGFADTWFNLQSYFSRATDNKRD